MLSVSLTAQEGASPAGKASPVPVTGKRGAKKQRVTAKRSDVTAIAAGTSSHFDCYMLYIHAQRVLLCCIRSQCE
jgi:hypothetical protein